MDWISKLRSFGIPENLTQKSAQHLEEYGLNPDVYQNLNQLYAELQRIWIQAQEYRNSVIAQEGWDPLQWLIDLLTWIGETLYGFIAPYIPDIGLILVGGVSLWFLPGMYKIIGVAPIAFAIWDVYQKLIPQE